MTDGWNVLPRKTFRKLWSGLWSLKDKSRSSPFSTYPQYFNNKSSSGLWTHEPASSGWRWVEQQYWKCLHSTPKVHISPLLVFYVRSQTNDCFVGCKVAKITAQTRWNLQLEFVIIVGRWLIASLLLANFRGTQLSAEEMRSAAERPPRAHSASASIPLTDSQKFRNTMQRKYS